MKKRRCSGEYFCKGECWLNVGGDFDIWDMISKKCYGTKTQQEILDELVNKKDVSVGAIQEAFKLNNEGISMVKEYYHVKE